MFNFTFDRKTMYTILAVLMIIGILEYIMVPGKLLSLLISVPGVLIAITFHEFAHAYVADKLGDDTARREGRLSLNPKDHLDPIGTLMLLVAGFGWGKPVHVDPRNYSRKMSMEKGEALVSIAGPIMNFILAFIFALIYCAIYKFGSVTFLSSTLGSTTLLVVSGVISINIGLGVFNLIPLPPLDGSKVLFSFLPDDKYYKFIDGAPWMNLLFILLIFSGLLDYPLGMLRSNMIQFFEMIAKMILGF